MDRHLIREALRNPRDLTKEEFCNGIKHSLEHWGKRGTDPARESNHLMEELAELNIAILNLQIGISKMKRKPSEDVRLNLIEEIGDALWAIGCLVEHYGLTEEEIKTVRRFKMERS